MHTAPDQYAKGQVTQGWWGTAKMVTFSRTCTLMLSHILHKGEDLSLHVSNCGMPMDQDLPVA
eukprot:3065182-Amphidinium_carterae.1